ncbi:MAG: permease-like cell division protein FtsX [Patescibacteria group bacterium]
MNIHLKTSIDYIRRSPFQALSAVSVLSLTFFVAAIMAILTYSSGKLISYFETRPQVIAFLKEDSTPEGVSALQRKLDGDSRVKNVKFVTKEEALEIYKRATADNPLLGELVSPSIFPASIEFSVTDLSQAKTVIEETKSEAIVDSVGFTATIGGKEAVGDVVEKLKNVIFYTRIGGMVLVGILALTSFLVLTVIIGMRISTRRGEIETLSLIGATQGFIRSPIIFEALGYAIMGVLIGWVFAIIAILYSTPSIISYFGEIPVLPRNSLVFFELLLAILGAELLAGIIISFLGATIAISRAQKQK